MWHQQETDNREGVGREKSQIVGSEDRQGSDGCENTGHADSGSGNQEPGTDESPGHRFPIGMNPGPAQNEDCCRPGAQEHANQADLEKPGVVNQGQKPTDGRRDRTDD
jgi:hypothetical protein